MKVKVISNYGEAQLDKTEKQPCEYKALKQANISLHSEVKSLLCKLLQANACGNYFEDSQSHCENEPFQSKLKIQEQINEYKHLCNKIYLTEKNLESCKSTAKPKTMTKNKEIIIKSLEIKLAEITDECD